MIANKYKGYQEWTPSNDEAADYWSNNKCNLPLLENEYLVVKNAETDEVEDIKKFKGGKLTKIVHASFKIKADKKTNSEEPIVASGKKKSRYRKAERPEVILPRNIEQRCAFDLLTDPDTTVKVITGKWGCGKSYLMIAAALQALDEGRFDQIVWIRNNVDVKDTKDLGALPGTELEKLLPFLGPFIDHAGEDKVIKMISNKQLVAQPLQSLRGRSWDNTIIICSEAENLTKEHIQLIIARAGENSMVWFDGDTRQRDKAVFEKSAGLEVLIDRLKGNTLFGYVHLVKTERSKTAELASLLDDN